MEIFSSQVFFVEVQHSLRARPIDDGQFRFRTVEPAVFVLGVPDQIAPELAVGVLASDGVDGLDQGVPRSGFGWRSLPVIVALLRVADHRG